MLDIKSLMVGVLCGIALVFVLGASHKKGKRELRLWACSNCMQYPTMTARQLFFILQVGNIKLRLWIFLQILNLAIGSWDLLRNNLIEISFQKIMLQSGQCPA